LHLGPLRHYLRNDYPNDGRFPRFILFKEDHAALLKAYHGRGLASGDKEAYELGDVRQMANLLTIA
jgi:hypothetical protein